MGKLRLRIVNRRFRFTRRVLVDAVVLAAIFLISYLLRFEFALPEGMAAHIMSLAPFVVSLQLVVAYRSGAYKVVPHYTSLEDLPIFVKIALWSAVVLLSWRFLAPATLATVPISVSLMTAGLGAAAILGVRVAQRHSYESQKRKTATNRGSSSRTVLIGAGYAGGKAAREILRSNMNSEIVGFVDDDPTKRDSTIAGIPILGTIEDLPDLASKLDIHLAVVTVVSPTPIELQ